MWYSLNNKVLNIIIIMKSTFYCTTLIYFYLLLQVKATFILTGCHEDICIYLTNALSNEMLMKWAALEIKFMCSNVQTLHVIL